MAKIGVELEKGLPFTKKRKVDDGIIELEFVDLKDEPLGSVPSILFWNHKQRKIYTQVTSMQHTLLVGDYGTGLHVSLSSALRYFLYRQDPDPGGCGQDAIRGGRH